MEITATTQPVPVPATAKKEDTAAGNTAKKLFSYAIGTVANNSALAYIGGRLFSDNLNVNLNVCFQSYCFMNNLEFIPAGNLARMTAIHFGAVVPLVRLARKPLENRINKTALDIAQVISMIGLSTLAVKQLGYASNSWQASTLPWLVPGATYLALKLLTAIPDGLKALGDSVNAEETNKADSTDIAAKESQVVHVDDTNFDEVVTNSKGLTLVDFSAKWCGPCQKLAPIMDRLSTELGNVKIAKLDVDESPQTAEKFGKTLDVLCLPKVVLFKDGKPVNSITPVTDDKAIYKMILSAV